MITLSYLGAFVCCSTVGVISFLFGFWIAALMAAAGRTDDQMGLRG